MTLDVNKNNLGFKRITYIPGYGSKTSKGLNHLRVTFTKNYVKYSILPIFRSTYDNNKIEVTYDIRRDVEGIFTGKEYRSDYTKLENSVRKLRKEEHYYDGVDNYIPTSVRTVLEDDTNETIDDCLDHGAITIIEEISQKYMPEIIKQILCADVTN